MRCRVVEVSHGEGYFRPNSQITHVGISKQRKPPLHTPINYNVSIGTPEKGRLFWKLLHETSWMLRNGPKEGKIFFRDLSLGPKALFSMRVPLQHHS